MADFEAMTDAEINALDIGGIPGSDELEHVEIEWVLKSMAQEIRRHRAAQARRAKRREEIGAELDSAFDGENLPEIEAVDTTSESTDDITLSDADVERIATFGVSESAEEIALADEVRKLRLEVKRHRAAQAADAERIRAVVLDVAHDELPHANVDHVSIARAIATRAAEQLATAAAAPLPELEQAFKAWFEYARDDEKPCWPEWVAGIRNLGVQDIPTARIEAGLAKLGAEHEPPAGWEQRVMDAADVEMLERIRRLVRIAEDETDLEWKPVAELELLDRLIAAAKVRP